MHQLPMIDHDKLCQIASQTNLELTAEEKEKFSRQLSDIVDWLDNINEVNTVHVLPTKNSDDRSNMIQIDDFLSNN